MSMLLRQYKIKIRTIHRHHRRRRQHQQQQHRHRHRHRHRHHHHHYHHHHHRCSARTMNKPSNQLQACLQASKENLKIYFSRCYWQPLRHVVQQGPLSSTFIVIGSKLIQSINILVFLAGSIPGKLGGILKYVLYVIAGKQNNTNMYCM